jgi:hypothetical protein
MLKRLALFVAAGALLGTPVAAATRGDLAPEIAAFTAPRPAARHAPPARPMGKPSPAGRPVRLADFKDRVVVLDCWRT